MSNQTILRPILLLFCAFSVLIFLDNCTPQDKDDASPLGPGIEVTADMENGVIVGEPEDTVAFTFSINKGNYPISSIQFKINNSEELANRILDSSLTPVIGNATGIFESGEYLFYFIMQSEITVMIWK